MSPTSTKQRGSRSAGPSAGRGTSGPKGAARRRTAPLRRPAHRRGPGIPPTFSKVAAEVARHLNRQRHEASAAALFFVAVVAGLGLFAGQAGPVGRGLAWLCHALLGWTAPALPFLLVWTGGLISRSKTEEAGRIAVGGLLTMVGLAAAGQVLFGNDAAGLRVEDLGRFGGVLGAGVAWPLERLISVWGAGLFAFLLTFLGVLVTTGTPFSKVSAGARVAAAATVRGCRIAWSFAAREVSRAAAFVLPRLRAWVSELSAR